MDDEQRPTHDPWATCANSACALVLLWALGYALTRGLVGLPAGQSFSHAESLFAAADVVGGGGFAQQRKDLRDLAQPLYGALLATATVAGWLASTTACTLAAPLLGVRAAWWKCGAAVAVWLALTPFFAGLLGADDALRVGLLFGAPAREGFAALLGSLPLAALSAAGPLVLLAPFARTEPAAVRVTTLLAWVAGSALVVAAAVWAEPGALAARVASAWAGGPALALGDAPRGAMWALVPVVLVGGAPGSFAGGMTVLVPAVLARFAWDGSAAPLARAALVALGVWLAAALGAAMLVSAAVPELSPDRAAWLGVAALVGLGVAHDALALPDAGLSACAFLLVSGRALTLATLAWLAARLAGELARRSDPEATASKLAG